MKKVFFVWLAFIFFGLMPSAVYAASDFEQRTAGMTAVTGIRVSEQDDKVRIVLDTERPVKFKTAALTSPNRVLVDIENAWIAKSVKKDTTLFSPYADKVRIAQFNPTTVRVVITTDVKKEQRNIFTLDNPGRLVLDFGNLKEANKSAKKESRQEKQEEKKERKEKEEKKDNKKQKADKKKDDGAIQETGPTESERLLQYYRQRQKLKGSLDEQLAMMTSLAGCIITIDPGHGGNDSGAIGPTGVMEKTVTLAVAKELRKLLEKEGATVYMTRETDTEVSPKGANATDIEELQARCNVANENKSHVFISIHMDSFTNNTAKGTTGYYYAMGSKRSRDLADKVRSGIIDQINTVSRGTQSCNFYVVKHTDMAATLVEVAFISNKNEEKMLNSEEGVKKAAQGIADGIADFFG